MAPKKREKRAAEDEPDAPHAAGSDLYVPRAPVDDSDDDQDEAEDEDPTITTLNVEFDATPPTEQDYHGIQTMIKQLFRTSVSVNLAELTELVIAQSHVGSVLRMFNEDNEDDEADEADEAAPVSAETPGDEQVYGVHTVLSLRTHAATRCIPQITTWLLQSCPDPTLRESIRGVLSSAHVGWVLSERFLNIPPQIAVPLYQSLLSDILNAMQTEDGAGEAFQFDYILLVSKVYEVKGLAQLQVNGGKKRRGRQQDQQRFYVNGEEELFEKAASHTFTFQIKHGADDGGAASGTDTKLFRTVFLMPLEAFMGAVEQLTEILGQAN